MIPVVTLTMTTGCKTTLLILSWFLYSSSPNNCKHVSRAGISIITVNLGERHAFSDQSICCEECIRETPLRNFPPMHNLFFYMFQLKHLTVTLIQIWTRIFFCKKTTSVQFQHKQWIYWVGYRTNNLYND